MREPPRRPDRRQSVPLLFVQAKQRPTRALMHKRRRRDEPGNQGRRGTEALVSRLAPSARPGYERRTLCDSRSLPAIEPVVALDEAVAAGGEEGDCPQQGRGATHVIDGAVVARLALSA